MEPDDIKCGLQVQHRTHGHKVGVLTGRTIPISPLMVEVEWGDETLYEPLVALKVFKPSGSTSFEDLMRRGEYADLNALRSLMTFEKLRGDLSNLMYSMQTAEIEFYPYQFLPVLKFVQSPLNRLLIADEVGLGKTIEAGLIWRECQARYHARRLLVICKPTLIPKWVRELQQRFGIDAEAADAPAVLQHIEKARARGSSHSFALVTSYQALRPQKTERAYLHPWLNGQGEDVAEEQRAAKLERKPRIRLYQQLCQWSESHPVADLVVFDESHVMRNTATGTYVVGETFSAVNVSHAAIALSATPLNNRSRDLYALLRLIDPDMFRSEALFNDLQARNRPAVQLANELTSTRPNFRRCLELAEELDETAAKRHLVEGLSAASTDPQAVSAETRLTLRMQAHKLNELGAYLNRTRKRDAVRIVHRTALTLTVSPTTEERQFYNAVLRLIRCKVKESGQAVSAFHLIAPALHMASCLPIMAERIRSGSWRWGDIEELSSIEEDFIEDADFDGDFTEEEIDLEPADLSWLAEYDFQHHDTKYHELRDALVTKVPGEKVIIFAFFKATLRYLQSRLAADGISSVLVTGDTKDMNERDRLLREFADSTSRVLLCSEVAAEGVDLQFCRIIVNYDLPWNPMRVEQRIGRIDRIGQKAGNITIINFNVLGTIDSSVFTHLHSKIHVFTQTIGDLEGIIGPHINKLTRRLLTDTLTPQQMADQIDQAAEAILAQQRTMAELEYESENLLGLNDLLTAKITSAQSLGRFIKHDELKRFTEEFFAERYTGTALCTLDWNTPAEGCGLLALSVHAMEDFMRFVEQKKLQRPSGFAGNVRRVQLTFDPHRHEECRLIHRKLVYINHLHPLIQWITSERTQQAKPPHAVSALQLRSSQWEAGVYLYLIMRFTMNHPVMVRRELVYTVLNVQSGFILDPADAENIINTVLDSGSAWASPTGYPDHSGELLLVSDNTHREIGRMYASFLEDLELRIRSKQNQIRSYYERRIQASRRSLATSIAKGVKKSNIQGIETKIENDMQRLDDEIAKLESIIAPQPEFKRVAAGIIRITRPISS